MAEPATALAAQTAEVITVTVCGQTFAIGIMHVREIRGWTSSTKLVHAPDYVVGMINLRGKVLPVIDLGLRLGLGQSNTTSSAVVMVVEIGDRQVGLLVDAVCDILTVGPEMRQAPPELGGRQDSRAVEGLITTDEGIVTLLTLEGVLPEGLEQLVA